MDISFRWRVANTGSGHVLLGGGIEISLDGDKRFAVLPGERYSVRPDEPRYMLQYVGFLTELPPGSIGEVSAWIQIGVENIRGQGPFDVAVRIADCSPGIGAQAVTVLEHSEAKIFSVEA